jgi:hypothetical protein
MGQRRIRIDKEVMASLLKAGFYGEGIVRSDAPRDLTVLRVLDGAFTPERFIDLVVESAEYSPIPEGVALYQLPFEHIVFDVTLYDRYPYVSLDDSGLPDEYDEEGDDDACYVGVKVAQ